MCKINEILRELI